MREANSEARVDFPQPDVPPNRIATDNPRSYSARRTHARRTPTSGVQHVVSRMARAHVRE